MPHGDKLAAKVDIAGPNANPHPPLGLPQHGDGDRR